MSTIKVVMGGKERLLMFTQGTNVLAVDKSKDFSDAEKKAFGAYCLIWAAMKTACIITDEVCDFSFADVCGWADTLSPETYAELIKAQSDLNNFKEPEEQTGTEEEKKSESLTTEPIV